MAKTSKPKARRAKLAAGAKAATPSADLAASIDRLAAAIRALANAVSASPSKAGVFKASLDATVFGQQARISLFEVVRDVIIAGLEADKGGQTVALGDDLADELGYETQGLRIVLEPIFVTLNAELVANGYPAKNLDVHDFEAEGDVGNLVHTIVNS